MKITIPNSSSVFQRFISISKFLLVLLYSTCISASSCFENEESLRFYTSQNTVREFSPDSTYLLLVKNNKSCLNCFQTLSEYLKELAKDHSISLHAAAFSDSSSLSRKRNIYELSTLFPGYSHLVTYSELLSDKITTPQLIIIQKNKIYHFKYEELFSEGFSRISGKVNLKIKSILDPE